jgi:hypothetical protein
MNELGGIDCRTRHYLLRSYHNCFLGREAVDWLVREGYARNTEDALTLGNKLMDMNYFHHVTGITVIVITMSRD